MMTWLNQMGKIFQIKLRLQRMELRTRKLWTNKSIFEAQRAIHDCPV